MIFDVSKKMFNFAIAKALGEMAEWSIAAVLKTVEGHTSGGSNPSPSAEKPDKSSRFIRLFPVYISPTRPTGGAQPQRHPLRGLASLCDAFIRRPRRCWKDSLTQNIINKIGGAVISQTSDCLLEI